MKTQILLLCGAAAAASSCFESCSDNDKLAACPNGCNGWGEICPGISQVSEDCLTKLSAPGCQIMPTCNVSTTCGTALFTQYDTASEACNKVNGTSDPEDGDFNPAKKVCDDDAQKLLACSTTPGCSQSFVDMMMSHSPMEAGDIAMWQISLCGATAGCANMPEPKPAACGVDAACGAGKMDAHQAAKKVCDALPGSADEDDKDYNKAKDDCEKDTYKPLVCAGDACASAFFASMGSMGGNLSPALQAQYTASLCSDASGCTDTCTAGPTTCAEATAMLTDGCAKTCPDTMSVSVGEESSQTSCGTAAAMRAAAATTTTAAPTTTAKATTTVSPANAVTTSLLSVAALVSAILALLA